jgi:hypothetical protein
MTDAGTKAGARRASQNLRCDAIRFRLADGKSYLTIEHRRNLAGNYSDINGLFQNGARINCCGQNLGQQ